MFENLHIIDISSTTYLLLLVNVVNERPLSLPPTRNSPPGSFTMRLFNAEGGLAIYIEINLHWNPTGDPLTAICILLMPKPQILH